MIRGPSISFNMRSNFRLFEYAFPEIRRAARMPSIESSVTHSTSSLIA